MNGENMLLMPDIGFWSFVSEKMPDSRFLTQSDRYSFQELVQASSLPCFVTDASENHRVTLANRISIPISDPEATVTYYLIMLLCEDSIFYTSGRISGQSGSFICIKSIHCFDQPDGPGRKQSLYIIVRTLILFYHMGYQTHIMLNQHISGRLVALFAAFQILFFLSC